MKEEKTTEQLVTKAVQGSRNALEKIIRQIQKPVYSLALRMLLHPSDAEDAAQEILTIVVTNLRGYRFEGTFRAWVMRIAANKLKAVRKTFMEKKISSVGELNEIMDRAEALGWFAQPMEAPEPYLEVEMRSVCTHAMLLALDRVHRMAFILGVVMEVSSQEGAQILDITPAAYRKRLSRARARIRNFLEKRCGLFDDSNLCHCSQSVGAHMKKGWINPDKLMFVSNPDGVESPTTLRDYLKELDELERISAIYQSVPPSDSDFVGFLKNLHENGQYRIISDPRMM